MSSNPEETREEAAAAAQPFVYASVSDSAPGALDGLWAPPSNAQQENAEKELQAREKAAWGRGVQEGETHARAEYEKALTRIQDSLAAAIREFGRERGAYYQRLETEAIRLVLAIARKVLHREAQMDPLVLTGVVRVALDKMSAGTTLKLRTHPAQVDLWNQYFTQQVDLPHIPEVIGDGALEHHQCVLETSLGVTDLGLETQLKEIEQGFFDLLAQKP